MDIIKKSRKRELKEDIIPIDNNARIGPNYNGQLMKFVSEYWNIERACLNSKSLNRTLTILKDFSILSNLI
jgi:hypothetical protein